MKGVLRSLLRSEAAHALASRLIVGYVALVRRTARWSLRGNAPRDRLRAEGGGVIVALWHNRIAMMPYAWPEAVAELTALTSAHRDGRFVSNVMRHYGMDTIEIDGRAGGSQALRRSLRILREGGVVAITPDGPRGPRMRVREGLVHIAIRSGCPVIPVTYAASRRRVLGSWDRFVLPLPFARIDCVWGEPIHPPPPGDPAAFESMRQRIETALTALSDAADEALGAAPIAPAPQTAAGGVAGGVAGGPAGGAG